MTVLITVRDFDLLDALSSMLATHDSFAVHYVGWHVDPDNPAWPLVRAAAIQAAIGKGRDYAAALGGSLDRVHHIADVGLLGGTGGTERFATPAAAFGMARQAGGRGQEADAPSLDPVPQELVATIEARFLATGVVLPQD